MTSGSDMTTSGARISAAIERYRASGPVPDHGRADPATAELLAAMQGASGELAHGMGIRITVADAGQVVGTMPVAGNRQPYGLLHGGASGVLAETVGSLHAMLIAPEGFVPVGTELSCTHHRGMRDGEVTGTSSVLHVGRSMATLDIAIRDAADRRVCTARLSCAFIVPRA
jgi:uncharacterized protein (TIGR00369 family)